MALGDPPIRDAPVDAPATKGLTPTGRPHIYKDADGKLHNLTPTPCVMCGGVGRVCLYCGRGLPKGYQPFDAVDLEDLLDDADVIKVKLVPYAPSKCTPTSDVALLRTMLKMADDAVRNYCDILPDIAYGGYNVHYDAVNDRVVYRPLRMSDCYAVNPASSQ